jgi:putative endonuclease
LKYFVYVLRSVPTGRYYIGMTGDPERRLQEHNSRNGRWTSSGKPWKLLGSEEYPNRGGAAVREAFLKIRRGMRQRLDWIGELESQSGKEF